MAPVLKDRGSCGEIRAGGVPRRFGAALRTAGFGRVDAGGFGSCQFRHKETIATVEYPDLSGGARGGVEMVIKELMIILI